MKNFKQYLKESDPGGGLDPFPDPISGTSSNFNLLSTASGYVAGLRANDQPYISYRSVYSPFQSALDPGKQSDDGRVQGGGGFKIEKDSRNFLINLAKKYGVEIQTPEEMQKQQQQKMQQGQQQGPPPQQPNDHLINQIKKHPSMYLLNLDQNLQKEFDKVFKSMQDWKLADKNPDEGKDWYTLWKEKQQKDSDQHKVNLGRMATVTAARERMTDIHHRLSHTKLASNDLPVKNYLDVSNHNTQPVEDQEEPSNYEYGFEYGDTE
jgi:hypothetical protein